MWRSKRNGESRSRPLDAIIVTSNTHASLFVLAVGGCIVTLKIRADVHTERDITTISVVKTVFQVGLRERRNDLAQPGRGCRMRFESVPTAGAAV
jgi:hypothetical protein